MPLYKLLKKSERFVWIQEAQQALDHLKHLLANAPILVTPDTGEKLLLYVAAMT